MIIFPFNGITQALSSAKGTKGNASTVLLGKWLTMVWHLQSWPADIKYLSLYAELSLMLTGISQEVNNSALIEYENTDQDRQTR